MLKRNTPKKAAFFTLLVIFTLLGGCATTQEKQVLAPQPDANVVEIISHVKQEPSMITGGGMIYEFFVGNRFAARYNEKSKLLKLTDFENKSVCEFEADGTLKLPENADEGYLKYCTHLSTNTIGYINQ